MSENHSTDRNSATNDPAKVPDSVLVLMLAINVVGILGNFFLIVAHVKDPLKVLKSPSSHFILNIASVDAVLSGILLVKMVLAFVATRIHWDRDTINLYFISALFLLCSTLFASYLSLAIERLLSVAYPLWHRVRITTKVCRYWVIGIWLGIGGFRLIDFALVRIMETTIQSESTYLVSVWVMSLLTLSVYIASYISIRRQRMEIQRTDMSEANMRTIKIRLENAKNFLVTIAIVCFVLAATVLPALTISSIVLVEGRRRLEGDGSSYAYWILLSMGLNSAVNVFVYLWRLPKYRKTFKKLYCNCCSL